MSSDKETKKYKAALILEMMGRPKEHLIETLENLIKKINSDNGVEVIHKKINEPHEIEKQKDLFTTFAEIEVQAEELIHLIILVFKYMPSHVELISPEHLNLDNNSFSDLLNEVTRRLHAYEELARVFQIEKKMLEDKIIQLSKGDVLVNSKPSEVEKIPQEKIKKKSKK